MADKEFYTLEECLDERFGVVGTPERDKFDADVAKAVHAYRVRESVKKARFVREEYGKRIGVEKAFS